jgi:type II secretory pathway component PulJ
MTLIEVTVTLALSALLLVTTAGVIKSMQQKKKVFADRPDVQPWCVELAECLRDDILRSREMRIGSKSLELSGFCGHDPATGEPVQTPVHVRWSLRKEGQYDILTRTETPRGGADIVFGLSEPVGE